MMNNYLVYNTCDGLHDPFNGSLGEGGSTEEFVAIQLLLSEVGHQNPEIK